MDGGGGRAEEAGAWRRPMTRCECADLRAHLARRR